MIEVVSNSPLETADFGKLIAKYINAPCVIALHGTLGSGKTNFTKGIACGLGIIDTLTSPTYTIINEYERDGGKEGSSLLYHIDAYRLKDENDFENVGGMEIINSECICIIEWSDRIINLIPKEAITVTLDISGPSSRVIKISGLTSFIESEIRNLI